MYAKFINKEIVPASPAVKIGRSKYIPAILPDEISVDKFLPGLEAIL